MILTVYIGYDSREPIALDVLRHSILSRASRPVNIQPIKLDRLKKQGLVTRSQYRVNGVLEDQISNAPCSTEFSNARFASLLLQQTGWAIFMDSDMVMLDDIYKIERELDEGYAVQCVQHKYKVREDIKMDGQPQTIYSRKNWSSFFAFNADHPANQNLTLEALNSWPGRALHSFGWLRDEEIGVLAPGWNWLVDVQERPDVLYNAHLTLGGPWFTGWKGGSGDQIWEEACLAAKTSPDSC